jgi:hypothetical protein
MNTLTISISPTLWLVAALGLGTVACRDPIPCSDCDDSAAEMEDVDPTPDLPCGGADLMTDPLNCGTCGNVCQVFPGTEWAAGDCDSGECVGPGWSGCLPEGFGSTCGSVCVASGATCAAGGCSGYTALLMQHASDFDDSCVTPDPYATMQGSCDEAIPYLNEGSTYVRCCCDWL